MNSNSTTEEQKLVWSMLHYAHKHHVKLIGIFRETNNCHDERSKRINEITFDILNELAFKAHDEKLKTLFGDEEE